MLDDVAVTAFGTADTIEVGQTSVSTLLVKDATAIAGGTLALGAAGGKGTIDVESAAGATLDDVTVTAFDATSGIEVGQTVGSTLLLKSGTGIKGAGAILDRRERRGRNGGSRGRKRFRRGAPMTSALTRMFGTP